MSVYKITEEKLSRLGEHIFIRSGLSKEDAKISAAVLTTNDIRGVHSHGSTMYCGYSRMLRSGGANPKAELISTGFGSIRICDGQRGLGVLSAYKAMQAANEAARETGVGIASVHGSTHAAALGYYAMMAAEQGFFGIAMSNGDPVMSIPGTKGRVMGNNPFAYAAPMGNGRFVLFDIAMSVIAGGKVKNFEIDKKLLPEGWLIDTEGNPTRDPAVFRKGGTLLPFAMHKGYGFAVMVEALSGVLSGAGIVRDNVDWAANPSAPNDIGHFLFALDIEKFMTLDQFYLRMQKMRNDIKSAPRVGQSEVMLPGEMEFSAALKQRNNGIEISEAVYSNIRLAAEETGLMDDFNTAFEPV
ncbi:MAG: Ldh family oxidoreductase [Oscillospiraceae bacterium]|nr:Ldh family oxidoreductase [Oscillospiraceae bacterium]